jgi:hypothetical protein
MRYRRGMSAQDSSPSVVISTSGLGDREIAAVTAVVTALAAQAGDATEESPQLVSGWNDRSNAVRAPLHPAPGAWRSFSG